MKKLLGSLFIFFISFSLSAQHCPWCGAMVVVVDISAEHIQGTIPNLHVELLKANGDTITNSVWNGKEWVDENAVFWQNAKETTDFDIWHTNPRKFHFWFAEDHYLLYCNYKMQKDDRIIRITDTDGAKNGGEFRTIEIEISKEDFYPLCTNFSNWNEGPDSGFVPGYRPVKVVPDLKK